MSETPRLPDSGRGPSGKSAAAFRTISEVAEELNVPQHVLRFWETKFNQIRPMKRGGGRRYYRPEDLRLLRRIRDLLYTDGFTIRGVQRLLREHGARAIVDATPQAGSAGVIAAPGNVMDGVAISPPEDASPAAAPSRRSDGAAPAPSMGTAALDARRPELEAVLADLRDLRSLLAPSSN